MDRQLLLQCIKCVGSEGSGYLYVQDLADLLFSYRRELGVNNIVVYWNVKYDSEHDQSICCYSNNQIINLDGFDLQGLSIRTTWIRSTQEGFDRYRSGHVLATSHIIAIPVNQNNHLRESCFPIKGVLLLLSQTSIIDIDDEQLTLLHAGLNSKYPATFSSRVYQRSLQLLKRNTYEELTAPQYFNALGESLDTISGKNTDISHKAGLRHFSLWNVVSDSEGEFCLIKEFNRNTFADRPHSDTNVSLACDTKHFLIDVIKNQDGQIPEGTKLLRMYPFSDVKQSLKGDDYFRDIGLTEENGTLLIVSYRRLSEIKIGCLYVCGLPYTIFVSSQLATDYVRHLCEFIDNDNVSVQNNLFRYLIESAVIYKTEKEFYAEASSIIKRVDETSDVLIYMVNGRREFRLKSEDNSGSETKETIIEFSSMALPKRYQIDTLFCDWMDSQFAEKHLEKGYVRYSDGKGPVVSTAMLVPVVVDAGIMGYVVLINKNHIPSSNSVFYYNKFSYSDYQFVRCCGMVFTQYQQLCNSVENRNYIIHKLRHEIPSNTDAIKNSVSEIRDGLQESPIRINHLLTVSNNIDLNNSRVMLLADFFTSVDFPVEKFAADKIKVNLHRFLNSYINIFRAEGKYKGVDVYFRVDNPDHCVYVSNYFQLAVVNVITNAIRYAASGTSVDVEVTENNIKVSDIGIPILENEMPHIYDEGYRSIAARRENGKGLGYGLYLSRRIIEAHGLSIAAECRYCAASNFFAQKAVSSYIRGLPTQSERIAFIHGGIGENEFAWTDKLYSEISNVLVSEYYQKYANVKPSLITEWMLYNKNNNYEFIDMGIDIFNKNVYEVIFTITL